MFVGRPLEFYKNHNGCWIVSSHKAKSHNGYPQITRNGKKWRIHRYMYEKHKGIIPNNLCVLHKCDNPYCANPEHLFLGTQKDNVRDAMSKGRMANGERSGGAKLTENDVREIRKMESIPAVIGKKYGVCARHVRDIKNRRRWRYLL